MRAGIGDHMGEGGQVLNMNRDYYIENIGEKEDGGWICAESPLYRQDKK